MTVSFRQHREFLIDYLRPQRLAVAVMSVLLLGSIALQLVTPQILSRFIDAARAGGAPDTLVRLAVLSLMVAGAGQLVSTCSAYASENVETDRKSTRLNSSHVSISYAVFCLKKKNAIQNVASKTNACASP